MSVFFVEGGASIVVKTTCRAGRHWTLHRADATYGSARPGNTTRKGLREMTVPMFTAEASLYATSNSYRSQARYASSPNRFPVAPQLGGPAFTGFQGCISDCLDAHRTWTTDMCAKACRDPGIAGTSSDSSLNDFLSRAGISFWETACDVNPFGVGCHWLANEMRRQT